MLVGQDGRRVRRPFGNGQLPSVNGKMLLARGTDLSVKSHVGDVEPLGRVYRIDAVDRLANFRVKLIARAFVEILAIDRVARAVLIDASFDAPRVGPLRRA